MAGFDLSGRRIWVAGHRGMVGSALCRRLESEKCEVITVDRELVDLRRQGDVEEWMSNAHADVVVIAAATVGGIMANDRRPAEFLYDNLLIEANIIHSAWRLGLAKLLLLVQRVSIPDWLHSLLRRTHSYPGRLSLQTNGTPSRKSLELNCVMHIAGNMVATLFPHSQQICMVRMIISTCSQATFCPP